MDDKEQSKEDIQRLKRELLETKHRLFLLEVSRPIKLVIFAKSFFKNPIKGITNIGGLREAFGKVVAPEPDFDRISISDRLTPLSLKANNPILRYPNIKAACLGTVDEVADVCHAFELGDANWMNLVERGIDLVLVSDEAFVASPNAITWLKTAEEKEIPLVVIKKLAEPLAKPLQGAKLVLDRTSERGENADKPFVDIFEHNPINWQREPKPVAGYLGKLPKDEKLGADGIEFQQVKGSSADKHYAAVIANTDEAKDFATASQLLGISASGVPVITYGKNKAEDKPFELVNTLEEAVTRCEELASDLEERERTSIQQRRQTVLEHSQLQRFEHILEKLGIERRPPEKISAILSTMRPENVKPALENFAKQTHHSKELVVVLHGDGFDRKRVEADIKEFGIEYKAIEKSKDSLFGDNLNVAVEAATGDFITKMDDDDHYGENHFQDLLAAYRYSRADVAGKRANWVYVKKKNMTTTWIIENQETYNFHLPGGTFMTSREFLRKTRFGRVKRGIESELYRRVEARGATLYSTHRYNYVRVRHGEHTYTASDEEFMSRCGEPTFKGLDESRTFV